MKGKKGLLISDTVPDGFKFITDYDCLKDVEKDFLSISPSHEMIVGCYYGEQKPINKTLERITGVLITGPVLILKSDIETGEPMNVEEDILYLLPEILRKDREQRQKFFAGMEIIDTRTF